MKMSKRNVRKVRGMRSYCSLNQSQVDSPKLSAYKSHKRNSNRNLSRESSMGVMKQRNSEYSAMAEKVDSDRKDTALSYFKLNKHQRSIAEKKKLNQCRITLDRKSVATCSSKPLHVKRKSKMRFVKLQKYQSESRLTVMNSKSTKPTISSFVTSINLYKSEAGDINKVSPLRRVPSHRQIIDRKYINISSNAVAAQCKLAKTVKQSLRDAKKNRQKYLQKKRKVLQHIMNPPV